MTTKEKLTAIVSIALVLGAIISYLAWLDSGCEIAGAMTWRGRICIKAEQ